MALGCKFWGVNAENSWEVGLGCAGLLYKIQTESSETIKFSISIFLKQKSQDLFKSSHNQFCPLMPHTFQTWFQSTFIFTQYTKPRPISLEYADQNVKLN